MPISTRLSCRVNLHILQVNSEAMTGRLLKKQISDPVQLVGQILYQADTWLTEVFEQADIPESRRNSLTDADKKNLDVIIPAAYQGEKVEDRVQMYTEDMARKVRQSYPTQVVAQLMETDEAFKLPSAHNATVNLLKNAEKKGFRLGETPVVNFLKSNADVTAGIAPADLETAQQQLQMVQRIYQITPGNEAMPVLIKMDMTSAYDVTAYSESQFISQFNAEYFIYFNWQPIPGTAELIFRKARQVSSVTYNLFTIASKMDSEPVVAGISAPMEVHEEVKNNLIKHFPTMESLFGSMDYCECEHCRSVLSPAAYFVDLLQFIDPESGVWENFKANWQRTHGGDAYPHPNPYDVLIERRPDLPHIALTCENTQTALPYIDIVNEILEYYVANERLTEQAVNNTGDSTTEELLAEPQNVIREAYEKVRKARYPLDLPFDLWIETVRQFCNYFEAPLEKVLETFREGDELFAPGQTFDRASVFMESLGFSPAELAIFIDKTPLANWHELYGFTSESNATIETTDTTGQRIDLNSAKALSRRLGVTYKEIVDIVQTGFVNPKLVHLHLLYKLGVSIRDARFYLDHKRLLGQASATLSLDEQQQQIEAQAFLDKLERYVQEHNSDTFSVTVTSLESDLQAIPFNEILVLADSDAGCNFDLTILQYADADGTKANPIDFLRINLFVRLWRKLGWSIEEIDHILTHFIPQSLPFDENPDNHNKQPLKTALIYIAHLKELDEKLGIRQQSLLKITTLWSDIATTGKQALYAQLFLTRSMLKTDPVFDHPLGQYLPSDTDVNMVDHLLTLQGSLGLTADEIRQILLDSNLSLDDAKLTLANVSTLYRYGVFAKALKLKMIELIILKQLSGLDPFKPLHPDPLLTIEQDHPYSQTLRFVEIAEVVKQSNLKIEDLDYLLRHRFDETGEYQSDQTVTNALMKTLAEGVRAIRTEHALPDDPGTLSEESLRQKLGLVLPPDVVARFLAMMNGTVEFTASKVGVSDSDKFSAEAFSDEAAVREVRYNATRQEQKITFRGVLFESEKNALLVRLPLENLNDLLDDIQQQARLFFEKYLQKQASTVQPGYGFLDASDFDLLFDKTLALVPDETEQDRVRKQQTRLVETFFPYLQQRLTAQFIVQTMTTYTTADAALIESLVTDKRLLSLSDSTALLKSLTAYSEQGVDAEFFVSNDLSGVPQPIDSIVHSVDMVLKNTHDAAGNLLNLANSARFEAYLEVPESGAYRFYIELDNQAAKAKLSFGHLTDPILVEGTAPTDNTSLGEGTDEFVELKPGISYPFTLELKNLNGGGARLLVQGETLPKGSLARLVVRPFSKVTETENAVLLLNKILLIVQSLGLSEREIRYILTHATDFSDVNFSRLPTQSVGNTNAEKEATIERFAQLLRLLNYALLKRDLAAGTDDLIDIFEANAISNADKLDKHVYPLLAKLTYRDEAMVKTTAEALVFTPSFENEKPLIRLWEKLQLIERFGVPVVSLLDWVQVVSSDVNAEQRFGIARDLKEAIKARFEPENWQRVAQPIFDKLRQRQRDSLVSHVMHQHGFDRIELLYEHFLIDPGMEPVVQTSRIRLAISSLQLFIQRSLLNLELKVEPSVINSKHWEWMKRYRVWEANRKIFLFPENWLEPEFRDDKTHLYTELEGALLQGDVSSDLVEDAFLNYLKKLDELARLDIVAMHVEDDPDPARRVLHVFGRTFSEPHKYFYRRYAHQMWTPWEPVSAEIQGDHLAPVIWQGRLYLFWVTFMDKPDENATPGNESGNLLDTTLPEVMADLKVATRHKQIDVQLHWSEYLQGEWSTRESGGYVAIQKIIFPSFEAIPLTLPRYFDLKEIFVHITKQYDDGNEQGVYIHLSGERVNQAFYLAGRNSIPETRFWGGRSKPANPYTSNNSLATRYFSLDELKVEFTQQIITDLNNEPVITSEPLSILKKRTRFSLLLCNNNLIALNASNEIASLIKPVFYQDNQHTLFVEPNVTEETIEEWDYWLPRMPSPRPGSRDPGEWDDLLVFPDIPRFNQTPTEPINPLEPPVDLSPVINPPRQDWLINPATILNFGGVLIGPLGQSGLEILPNESISGGDTPVNITPGNHLGTAGRVISIDESIIENNGLLNVADGLNVVGNAGLNSVLERDLNDFNSGRFDRLSGAGRIPR